MPPLLFRIGLPGVHKGECGSGYMSVLICDGTLSPN
jgi:hypothetical protein